MTETELELALSKSFAACAFYRQAIDQIRELTKGHPPAIYSIRRSCSEALDAVDIGSQFMEILVRLQTENIAFRQVLGNNVEQEIVH